MIPFLVQVGLYITPIAYPAELIVNSLPQYLTVLYFMNPMACVVEGFRWSIFGMGIFNIYTILSFIMVMVLLVSGLAYFKRTEKVMADLV
jgi:lipopolysaccharide transport system permease protein